MNRPVHESARARSFMDQLAREKRSVDGGLRTARGGLPDLVRGGLSVCERPCAVVRWSFMILLGTQRRRSPTHVLCTAPSSFSALKQLDAHRRWRTASGERLLRDSSAQWCSPSLTSPPLTPANRGNGPEPPATLRAFKVSHAAIKRGVTKRAWSGYGNGRVRRDGAAIGEPRGCGHVHYRPGEPPAPRSPPWRQPYLTERFD